MTVRNVSHIQSKWCFGTISREILYIETDKNRYEFLMEAIDSFSLYMLLGNMESYYTMVQTGRPVDALKKVKIATGVEWKQIIWGKDEIRFNKFVISNIRAIFWLLFFFLHILKLNTCVFHHTINKFHLSSISTYIVISSWDSIRTYNSTSTI